MTIELNNLSFSFKEKAIFDKVNVQIPGEGLTLLLGANGSGKTTFCRLLMGLEKGYTGSLRYEEIEAQETETSLTAERIVYLKQNAELNLLAATPEIDLGLWNGDFGGSIDEDKIHSALKWFNIEELTEQPVWELSGGQLQRLALASLVLNEDKYWLLDEPAAGLDAEQQSNLIRLLEIHKKSSGCLIITHRFSLFEKYADHIWEIKEKSIIKRK